MKTKQVKYEDINLGDVILIEDCLVYNQFKVFRPAIVIRKTHTLLHNHPKLVVTTYGFFGNYVKQSQRLSIVLNNEKILKVDIKNE